VLKFDDRPNVENDCGDEIEGIKTVVDKRSTLFLQGTTIDRQTPSDERYAPRRDMLTPAQTQRLDHLVRNYRPNPATEADLA
jgi:hypothetical protein